LASTCSATASATRSIRGCGTDVRTITRKSLDTGQGRRAGGPYLDIGDAVNRRTRGGSNVGPEDIQAMRARLARAERRLRMTSLSWLVAVIVIAVLWMGAQQAQSQTSALVARRIAVQDQNGRDRIILSFDTNNRPAIWLRDDAGKDRIFIGFGSVAGRPLIGLNDEAGRLRLSLTFNVQRGTPELNLFDENAKQRASLSFATTGASTPQLQLADEKGTDRIYLGWSTAEKPVVLVTDESGKTLWAAP
jgi:hypothetical protein